MMLGHPEGVVAALVHALGICHYLVQRLRQLLLRVTAVVDRRAGVAEIFHVGCAIIGAVEFRDHRVPSQMPVPTVTGGGGFVQRNRAARSCPWAILNMNPS